MGNRKIKAVGKTKRLKFVLMVLGIWWTLAVLLATFQAYFMTNSLISFPIGILFAFLVFYMHILLYKKLLQNRKKARLIYFIYTGIHFIPLLLQFTGIQSPGLDNIVTALIGLVMILAVEK